MTSTSLTCSTTCVPTNLKIGTHWSKSKTIHGFKKKLPAVKKSLPTFPIGTLELSKELKRKDKLKSKQGN